MWLQIEFHGLLMFVLCCYHPPKPYYAAAELQNAITCDLDILLTRHSDAIIIVAGDFNSLETGFLDRDFGLQQMVTSITHGSRIIDKIFVSHVDYFVCSTVKSIVKTKHLAVLLLDAISLSHKSHAANQKKN